MSCLHCPRQLCPPGLCFWLWRLGPLWLCPHDCGLATQVLGNLNTDHVFCDCLPEHPCAGQLSTFPFALCLWPAAFWTTVVVNNWGQLVSPQIAKVHSPWVFSLFDRVRSESFSQVSLAVTWRKDLGVRRPHPPPPTRLHEDCTCTESRVCLWRQWPSPWCPSLILC